MDHECVHFFYCGLLIFVPFLSWRNLVSLLLSLFVGVVPETQCKAKRESKQQQQQQKDKPSATPPATGVPNGPAATVVPSSSAHHAAAAAHSREPISPRSNSSGSPRQCGPLWAQHTVPGAAGVDSGARPLSGSVWAAEWRRLQEHYCKSRYRSIDWLASWEYPLISIDWLIEWLVGRSIDWLIDWLIDFFLFFSPFHITPRPRPTTRPIVSNTWPKSPFWPSSWLWSLPRDYRALRQSQGMTKLLCLR